MTEAGMECRRSLLAVDDDSIIRTLLHTALAGKYDILCVPNGAEVPALIANRKPGLIILDIHAPGSEGYALCAGVRDQAALQHVPILFMTVVHGDERFFESLKTGGNSYIRKPFEMPALKSRIEALLKPAPAA